MRAAQPRLPSRRTVWVIASWSSWADARWELCTVEANSASHRTVWMLRDMPTSLPGAVDLSSCRIQHGGSGPARPEGKPSPVPPKIPGRQPAPARCRTYGHARGWSPRSVDILQERPRVVRAGPFRAAGIANAVRDRRGGLSGPGTGQRPVGDDRPPRRAVRRDPDRAAAHGGVAVPGPDRPGLRRRGDRLGRTA